MITIYKNDHGFVSEININDTINNSINEFETWRTSTGIPAPIILGIIKKIIDGESWEYIDIAKDEYEESIIPIEDKKEQKILELRNDCTRAIFSGFDSSALGSLHHYNGEYENQINIIGATFAGIDIDYSCTDLSGLKLKRTHTAAQMKIVFDDGLFFKNSQITKLFNLELQVEPATTKDEIDLIIW